MKTRTISELMQEEFDSIEYRKTEFGTLFVTPLALEVMETFYGGEITRSKVGASTLYIAMKDKPNFDSAHNPSKKELYLGIINPRGARNLLDIVQYLKGIKAKDVSMDEEVAERFEKDHGSLMNYGSALGVVEIMEADPFFEMKYNGERMEISFAAPYHQRQDVRQIENILPPKEY